MDDATSSPSDSASTATDNTTTSASERGFAPKPRRLARGLNDLFSKQNPGARPIPPGPRIIEQEIETPPPAAASSDAASDATVSAGPIELAAPPQPEPAPAAFAPTVTTPKTSPAPTNVDASPVPTGFEYRFVQLVSRLDATCTLLSDARQTHVVAAQRSGRIAWGVAAILAIAAGVSLWWAGSTAAWKGGQLEYEQSRSLLIEKNLRDLMEKNAVISSTNQTLSEQQQALARKHDQMQKSSEATRAEIETIRSSLMKANAVIDELMSKPQATDR